ncbi:MAG: hypothetical protein JWR34_4971 [Mycobacterium sp.]|nr:hypothetical protein [Mycobacterium sp.]
MHSRRFWKTDKLTVELEYDEDTLTFSGVDTGGWSGTSEYEYSVSVKATDLRAALGVDAAADLGEVLCGRAEEIIAAGESRWLTTLGLEPSVRTWSSYPD